MRGCYMNLLSMTNPGQEYDEQSKSRENSDRSANADLFYWFPLRMATFNQHLRSMASDCSTYIDKRNPFLSIICEWTWISPIKSCNLIHIENKVFAQFVQ